MNPIRLIFARIIQLFIVISLIIGAVFSACTAFFTSTAILLDYCSSKIYHDENEDDIEPIE